MADIERIMLKYPIGREVTVLEDGHVEKHTVKRYIVEERDCYIDMADGVKFHAKRLSDMEIVAPEPETAKSILAEATRELCDHYCKYPGLCATDEDLNEKCEECPVTRRIGI